MTRAIEAVLLCSLAICVSAPAAAQISPNQGPSINIKLVPDLVVSGLEFEGGAFIGPCNRVAVTIRNAGQRAVTAPVTVRLTTAIPVTEQTPISVDRQHAGGIAAGGSATIHFDQFLVGLDPAQVAMTFAATVDPSNEIAESSETNNLRSVGSSALVPARGCPVISVSPATGQEGRNLLFQVYANRGSFPRPVSVSYSTASVNAAEGTSCTKGVDYIGKSGTLEFPPGPLPPGAGQVWVETCLDPIVDRDETFQLRLSSPVNATIQQSQGQATGLIRDVPPG